MNVGFSIPIHQESEKYIKETLSQYTEINKRIDFIDDPIIHIYAIKDTRDLGTGELNGYSDSLFCEYHFYDLKNETVYKSRQHDGLWFGEGVSPSNVKIFKDGSTLVQLRGRYDVMIGTSVHLELL